MQIPVLSGIYADVNATVMASYPVNMVPVPQSTGVSTGYIRTAEGAIAETITNLGMPRGGIEWKDECYRVIGSSLIKVYPDASFVIIGDVGTDNLRCTFDYSFDRLAITSAGKMYYWDGTTLKLVADSDLGIARVVKWIDGYFMTTDGINLVITELADPFSVNPLKYGSSEVMPDSIQTLVKLRNEIYAINRYSIEVFSDVGGDLFPFQRIEGAYITKGAIGSYAACAFGEHVAFVGSGRNEAPGVYLGVNGAATKISTHSIDLLFREYTVNQLSTVVLETRVHESHQHLWIRLPDRTLVYDLAATQVVGEPVWFQLTTASSGFAAFRAVDLVYCYDKWLVADVATGACGYLTNATAKHFGATTRWEFGTGIAYNESRGALILSMELACLTGSIEPGTTPHVSTSYSVDGVVWSQDRTISMGQLGSRTKRLAWHQLGHMSKWRIQRFRGDSNSMLAVLRLEASLEALSV